MTTLIVNGQERELRYDNNGIDISADFIGNTSHGMAHDEEGRYIASEEDYKWWRDVISAHEEMDATIQEYKEENDAELVDQVVNDWAVGNDYEMHPAQVTMGLEQAFGKSPRHPARGIAEGFDEMYNGDDRVQQVNEIERLASDLSSNDWEWETSDQLVGFWLVQKPDLPDWWDDHDTRLLYEFIERERQ